jgi:glycosyltransferase involved in cell wall biosynthesis
MTGAMRVSAIVPTRNRGAEIVPAVASVLANDGPALLELLLVDQSITDASERALDAAGLLVNERLRYCRMPEKGASRARNLGIREAHGDILAFTDDDCLIPPTWASVLAERFSRTSDLALLFPSVEPAPEVGDGFIPAFRPLAPGRVAMTLNVVHDLGMSANLAALRSAALSVGPFDEFLGAGAVFGGAEDKDFGYRAMRRGLRVDVSIEPSVIHYGVRSGAEVARLGALYLAGIGAMEAKHARCGDRHMRRAFLRELSRWLGEAGNHLARGQRPSGLGHAQALLRGALASFRYGVDRRTRLFYERSMRR